ncbi:MAG: hypothetical protein OQL20_02235 [Sedimenticola sp.]|nr:hypothetical protein [Sedimenticola sp.]
MNESTPNNMTSIALILWAIISAPLLGYLLWSDLQENYFEKGVTEGSQITAQRLYADIIAKANNAECNTIFVEQENTRVDLINIRCLQVVTGKSGASEKVGSIQDESTNGRAAVGKPAPTQKQ